MSRTTVRARGHSLAMLGALGAVCLTLVTGCGVGQVAETAEIQSAIAGVNANAGTMALRNIRVAYPDGGVAAKGGSATLLVTFINTSIRAQRLVSVTSPVAGSVELSDGTASSPSPSSSSATGASASPSTKGSANSSASASASSSASTSASSSASASASPSTDTSASASSGTSASGRLSLRVPGQDNVTLTRNGTSITLLDLTQSLVSGRTISITFRFSTGSSVTAVVPISVPSQAQDMPTATPSSGIGEPSTGT